MGTDWFRHSLRGLSLVATRMQHIVGVSLMVLILPRALRIGEEELPFEQPLESLFG